MYSNRFRSRINRHHLPLALGTLTSVVVLFVTRPYRDSISRLSFATAYPALLLLLATLLIGPFNVVLRRRNPISSDLRRDLGVWAGLTGVVHAVVGQCVHLRGRPWLYYIYERGTAHRIPLRHDLFGFANDFGMIASLILIALLATSNDRSLRALGTPGWKQLQRWNYLCFAAAALHTALYQTIEGKANRFVLSSALAILLTVVLQLLGLIMRRAVARQPIQTPND